MSRQRCAILRALIRWCGAEVKRHRWTKVFMLTASATVIGLLLVFAPPAAMSRQVGPKAPPPINKRNSPDTVNPRPMPKMRKLPPRRLPAPKAQTLSDEQRAKILAELSNSFVKIPAGEFMMGSENGKDNEKPVHRVRISHSFEIGKYEVTQAQWEAVMDSNPSQFKGTNLPVDSVSWDYAQEFIKKLNARDGGYVYRLPTEAEWEYACRAGTTTEFAFGNSLSLAQANFGDEAVEENTTAVGNYQPNAWGLYDMHGNVYEWCQDWYSSNYYMQSANVDPQGPATGSEKVIRGGACGSAVRSLRSAYRNVHAPDGSARGIGFRLVRTRR